MDIANIVKNIYCYANRKPCTMSHIKGLLNGKGRAFKNSGQWGLKHVQRELKVQLMEVKKENKRMLKQKLQNRNNNSL